MTYVDLSPVSSHDRNTFVASVTLVGNETGVLTIPHGISTVPVMFWATMTATSIGIDTGQGIIPVPFSFFLSVDAVNVKIASSFDFVPCTFRLYATRPHSITL